MTPVPEDHIFEPYGLLVLTDSESRGTNDVWPVDGVSAVSDCVSIRLAAGWTPQAAADVHIEVLSGATADTASDVLWSGTLALPSGVLIVSGLNLAPLARADLVPGSYRAVVARPRLSERLLVTLTRLD